MPDGKRLWRTSDGRLVEDGHPDAAILAYGVDDELAKDDQTPEKPEGRTTAKATGSATSKRTGKK